MKIILLEPYGYCAGVARAINIAKEAKQNNKNKEVVILGMLVHNQDALLELENEGIKTIYHKDKNLMDLIDEVPQNSIVILTAHGHAKDIEIKLNKLGIEFIDATCPFVTSSFKLIKSATENNHDVLYIGKANHPESNAALSLSNKVHLLDVSNPVFNCEDKSPFVINQTTFSKQEVSKITDQIISKYNTATIHPGTCDASTRRQNALLSLPKDVELIYIVGGTNSNNTRTLAKIAEENYPLAKVLTIQNASNINKKDLLGLNCVAISSGASTPKHISEEIKLTIEQLLN